ncbi:MAG: hypothetical protein K2G83_05850, partial [Ruminococcus sp.]|nr:hypothetical protein [Ruminococcus sp.]
MNIQNLVSALSGGRLDCTLAELYGHSEIEILRQRARFINAAEHFSRLYPEHNEIRVFSAPACTGTGGIHTYKHNGCILSVTVTHDMIAIAGFNNDRISRIKVDESELFEVHPDSETDESICSPLVREIDEQFRRSGIETGGFDLYISSDIPDGCNLSVNGVFDMLIEKIIDSYYNDDRTERKICSVGGFVFSDLKNQKTKHIVFDFSRTGYSLCITRTGNTYDLHENYLAVSIDENEFYEKMPEMRKSHSDEEIIRTLYFIEENERAVLETDALKMGKLDEFFRLINESGNSSVFLQQNPSVILALKLSRFILNGSGAVRINADVVQAFVPSYNAEYYA